LTTGDAFSLNNQPHEEPQENSTFGVGGLLGQNSGNSGQPARDSGGLLADQRVGSLAICTVILKNYLAYARCLTESFLAQVPNGRVYVLLVDQIDGYFDPAREKFTCITVAELGIPGFESLAFRYTVVELSTAVKPFFLEYLFRHYGMSKLCFFDPDIIIYSSLAYLADSLDTANILLTPHLSGFLDDEHRPNELNILQAGAYNLGFIALANNDQIERFLKWWQRKLILYSASDIAQGLFTDQRWIDLVPTLFEGVQIIHDAGYNVAYWNLSHRKIELQQGEFRVNGGPLAFFHFSGYTPDRENSVSRHQNRFEMSDVGEAKTLFYDYATRLRQAGYDQIKSWPYAFGYFSDGISIPDFARSLYRETSAATARWPDPFNVQISDNYRDWLNEFPEQALGEGVPKLTRLAREIYQRQLDLQQAFPDLAGSHRLAYAVWLIESGPKQIGLPDIFLDPLRQATQESASYAQRAAPLRASGARSRALTWLLSLNYSATGRLLKRALGASGVQWLKTRFWGAYRNHFLPPTTRMPQGQSKQTRFSITDVGVNVIGYLRSETGMGEAMRSTLRALAAINYPVAATAITRNDLARKADRTFEYALVGHPYSVNLFHVNAEQTLVIRRELGPEFFQNKCNIGYWYWETAAFPAIWRNRFELFSEIWVASSFTQQTLAAVSPVPVLRIRPAIQVNQFAGCDRAQLGLPEDRFLFLFTFDMLSIVERKNPLGLLAAYERAFGRSAPHTGLVIKANNFRQSKAVAAALGLEPDFHVRFREAVGALGGILLIEELDRPVVTDLHRLCDCYISLHRSEGFGLSLAESMYLGKPCIATGYSSNLDFMTAHNSFLVQSRLVELQQDYGPYQKGTVWAEPDLDHAASLMQSVVANPEEARARGQKAAEDIRAWYDPALAGTEIANRLKLIANWAA